MLLLVIGGLSLLGVAAYFLLNDGGSAETAPLTAVDLPVATQPPEPPVGPARARAVEELGARLPGITGAHVGTHGVVVFDPYSGETASFNADRRFVAASLSKLYALLTLYRAASNDELSLDDEITMRSSDVWADGTGVLSTARPVGTTMTLRECATFMVKESDNTAEVMLNRYLGERRIEAELHRVGADSTTYWSPQHHDPERHHARAEEDSRSFVHQPRALGRDARAL